MKVTDIFSGGRIFGAFWISVSLGSCSIIQHIDNSTSSFFVLGAQQESSTCEEFVRTPRLGHAKPQFPKINLHNLSPSEVNDVLLTYAEKLKSYMYQEDRFIEEDILRYNSKCQSNSIEFLKKDLGYNMGTGDVGQLTKVP
jgi:hypothetical protein